LGAKKRHKKRRPGRLQARQLFFGGGVVALLLVVGVFALLAFRGDDAPRRRVRVEPVVTTERDVTITVDNTDYEPRDLTVPRGATVTWSFEEDLPHNVVDDRGAFESPILQKGDAWSKTFDEAGTFTYYCTLHHIMQGTLVVAE
jgi:plastocyanin